MSRRLLGTYLLLALIVLVALEVPLGLTHAREARQGLEARVERDAATLATFAQGSSGRDADWPALRRAVRRYAREADARVVILDRRGRWVLDTGAAAGRSFAARPEIRGAMAGLVAGDVHPSRSSGRLVTVAVPVAAGGRVDGAVRVSVPSGPLERVILRYWLMLAGIAAVVLAATAAVGQRLAHSVAAPLGALERDGGRGGRGPERQGARRHRAAGGPCGGARLQRDGCPPRRPRPRTGGLRGRRIASAQGHPYRAQVAAREHRAGRRPRRAGGSRRCARRGGASLAARRRAAGARPGRRRGARTRDVDVRVALSERARAWAALAEGQGVRLEVAPGPPLTASATPDALAQVLDNLLANALDVSPPGAALVLHAEPDPPEWVALHVLDEGPGMTSEARARAFDRFWRGRSSDGFGLGLAIVRRLVAADGGCVELRARPRGLDAVVYLKAVGPAGL